MTHLPFAVVVFVVAVFGVGLAPHNTEAATTSVAGGSPGYDVIGVGDSIGRQVFPTVAVGEFRWLNGEASRAPTVAGVAPSRTCGTPCFDSSLSASATNVLTWALPSVRVGGFVIVQEGGLADKNGTYLTLSAWTDFVSDVLALVPDNRTLVFVYPAYDPSIGGGNHEDVMYARTIAARTLIQASSQPTVTVNWWYAVHSHPLGSATPYTIADGLHPSAAGAAWLAAQLTNAVT